MDDTFPKLCSMFALEHYVHTDMDKGIIGIKSGVLANKGRCSGCGHSMNEYC